MGYYTRYTLNEAKPDESAFVEALKQAIDHSPFDGDSHKWYEHDVDIKRAMLASGATLVEIHGEGERQGDVWDKTFTLVDEAGQRIEIRTTKYRLVKEQP
jgi:hypothetical protein